MAPERVPLRKRGRYFRAEDGSLVRYWHPPRWQDRDTAFAGCFAGLATGCLAAGFGAQHDMAWLAVLGGFAGIALIIGSLVWYGGR